MNNQYLYIANWPVDIIGLKTCQIICINPSWFFPLIQIARADIEIERETYQTSRSGLNEMYTEAKEKLQEETQAKQVSIIMDEVSVI